jgi:hypothetical protein
MEEGRADGVRAAPDPPDPVRLALLRFLAGSSVFASLSEVERKFNVQIPSHQKIYAEEVLFNLNMDRFDRFGFADL